MPVKYERGEINNYGRQKDSTNDNGTECHQGDPGIAASLQGKIKT